MEQMAEDDEKEKEGEVNILKPKKESERYTTVTCALSSLVVDEPLRAGCESTVKVGTRAGILGSYLALRVLVRIINKKKYFKPPNQTFFTQCMMAFIHRDHRNEEYPCDFYPEIEEILKEDEACGDLLDREDGNGLEYVIASLGRQAVTNAMVMISSNFPEWISDWCERQLRLLSPKTTKNQFWVGLKILKSWILHRIPPVKIPKYSEVEMERLRQKHKLGKLSQTELDKWLDSVIGTMPENIASDNKYHKNSLYEEQRKRAKFQLQLMVIEKSEPIEYNDLTMSTVRRWLLQYGQAYRKDTDEMSTLNKWMIKHNWSLLYPWIYELQKSNEVDTLFFQAKKMDVPKGICKTFSLLPLPGNEMRFITVSKYTLQGLVKFSNSLLEPNTKPYKLDIWWKGLDEFRKCEGLWKRKNKKKKGEKYQFQWQSLGIPHRLLTDGLQAKILYKLEEPPPIAAQADSEPTVQVESTLQEMFVPGSVFTIVDLGHCNFSMAMQVVIGDEGDVKFVDTIRTRGKEAKHIKGSKLKAQKVNTRLEKFKIKKEMVMLLSFKVSDEDLLRKAYQAYVELYPKIREAYEGKEMRQFRFDGFRRDKRGNDILAGKIVHGQDWATERKKIKLPRSRHQSNQNKVTRWMINLNMREKRKALGLNPGTHVILGDWKQKKGFRSGYALFPILGIQKPLLARGATLDIQNEHLTSSICPCCLERVNEPKINWTTDDIYFSDNEKEEVKGNKAVFDFHRLLTCKQCAENGNRLMKFDRDILGDQCIFYSWILAKLQKSQSTNKNRRPLLCRMEPRRTPTLKSGETGPTQFKCLGWCLNLNHSS